MESEASATVAVGGGGRVLRRLVSALAGGWHDAASVARRASAPARRVLMRTPARLRHRLRRRR